MNENFSAYAGFHSFTSRRAGGNQPGYSTVPYAANYQAPKFTYSAPFLVKSSAPAWTEERDRSYCARSSKQVLETFLNETEADDRADLLRELNAAVLSFLEMNCPVYLEGLGLLLPTITSGYRTHLLKDKTVIRDETRRTIVFEKCYELTSFHRSRYTGIVETRELSRRIYPRLPLHLSVLWSERRTRAYIRGLVEQIKHEIILNGHSAQLGAVGDFFALHNRQGNTLRDWYAGADVFLDPYFEETLHIGPSRVCERQELATAWEMLEANHGRPIGMMEVNILDELSRLGYDTTEISKEVDVGDGLIKVAVFVDENVAGSEDPNLIYCTDGLRRAGLGCPETKGYGTEFTFQMPIKWAELEEINQNIEMIPTWPARPLTMGWILMTGARSKSVRLGAGLSCGVPLNGSKLSPINTVFTTSYSGVKGAQITPEGEFHYINLTGITEDEARVARMYSPDYLLTLLRYKKIEQLTRVGRTSIVARTNLLSVPEAEIRKPTLRSQEPGVARRA